MSLTGLVLSPSPATAAAVFSDGFESGNTSAWTGHGPNFTARIPSNPIAARSGSYAGEASSTGGGQAFAYRTLPAPASLLYTRVWFYVVSHSTKAALVRLRPTVGQVVTVTLTANDGLSLVDTPAGKTMTSAAGLVSTGVWHLLQVRADETAGAVAVWLDGTAVAKLTKSVSLGSTQMTTLELGDRTKARGFDIYFDDAAVDDGSYIGPSAPTGVAGTSPGPTEADLTWAPPVSTDPPVTYTIYRSVNAGDPAPPVVGTSSTRSYADTTTTASTTYYYWVDAVDSSSHHSALSDPPAQVLTANPTGTPPSKPTGLAAAAPGSTRVDLTWTANPAGDGVTSYTVFRAPDALTTPVPVGTVSGVSYSDRSAAANTRYLYSIVASSPGGYSPASDAVGVTTPSDTDPMVAAGGDIACDPSNPSVAGGTAKLCQQAATAALLGAEPYSLVLPLGDNQYTCGGLAAYQQVYDPTWGRYLSISMPVPGNHEYLDNSVAGTDCAPAHDAPGYYATFASSGYGPGNLFDPAGARPVNGDPAKGYYSYDVAGWHVIALNAECAYIGGCDAGSAEETWLANDLASHPDSVYPCTLAYWHQPRWGEGIHASDPTYDAFWQDLYAAGADVVLNGHDHLYERYVPQDPSGAPDPAHGITEIIAGTGGEGHAKLGTPLPTSAVRDNTTFGILGLTLHPSSFEWTFHPASIPGGGSFTESGATMCHGAP